MKKWQDIFRSQETRFLELLVEQTQATLNGTRVLYEFVMKRPSGNELENIIEKMSLLEKQGDEVRKNIVEKLLSTFVTPFDREDINSLSLSIDDILDYADSTIKELVMYDVEPNPAMQKMVRMLRDGVVALRSAVENMLADPEATIRDMITAKRAENRVEDLYRHANAELFSMTDMHHIFKVREVYRHLSNSADRADEAADIIGAIVIKGNV